MPTPWRDAGPASVRQACGTNFLNAACGVQNYRYGGTGFIESLTLDSIQFKPVFTYLFSALGHHVLKAGFEGAAWHLIEAVAKDVNDDRALLLLTRDADAEATSLAP